MDEIIKIVAYCIGMIEVESVCFKYLVVVECGVVGRFDEICGEVIFVFVFLKQYE